MDRLPYKKTLIAAAGLVAAAVLFSLWRAGSVDEVLAFSPLRCPLKFFAGIPCPTCGLGHSIAHLLRGEWAMAFEAHPLGPLAFLFFLAWLVRLLFISYFDKAALKKR